MNITTEINNILDFHLHDLDKIVKLKELLRHTQDVNFIDIFGRTILHKIIIKNSSILEYLLSMPSLDLNIKDKDGNAPIHIALQNKKYKEAKLLLHDKRIDKNILDHDNNSCLHIAVSKNDYLLTELFVHNGLDLNLINNTKETALHIAIKNKNIKIIELLLSRPDIDLNILDEEKLSPLVISMEHSLEITDLLIKDPRLDLNACQIDPFILAIKSENLDLIKKMLPIYNKKEFKHNFSPLHAAAEKDNLEIFEYIYEHFKKYINILDDKDSTPLHKALYRKQYNVFNFLLNKTKDINFINHEGYSYLHYAVKLEDFKMLTALLSREDINIYIKDKQGNSPLYNAIKWNRLSAIQLLLQKKYDFTEEGEKILDFILEKEKIEIAKMIKSLNLVLAHKKNVIEIAIQKKSAKILKIALLLGYDPNGFINDKPIIHAIIESGQTDLADILFSSPAINFNVKYENKNIFYPLMEKYNQDILEDIIKYTDIKKITDNKTLADIRNKNMLMYQIINKAINKN